MCCIILSVPKFDAAYEPEFERYLPQPPPEFGKLAAAAAAAAANCVFIMVAAVAALHSQLALIGSNPLPVALPEIC